MAQMDSETAWRELPEVEQKRIAEQAIAEWGAEPPEFTFAQWLQEALEFVGVYPTKGHMVMLAGYAQNDLEVLLHKRAKNIKRILSADEKISAGEQEPAR